MIAEDFNNDFLKLKRMYIKKLADFIQTNTETTDIREVEYQLFLNDDNIWFGNIYFKTEEGLKHQCTGFNPLYNNFSSHILKDFYISEEDAQIAKKIGDYFESNISFFGTLLGDGSKPVTKNFCSVKKNQLSLTL